MQEQLELLASENLDDVDTTTLFQLTTITKVAVIYTVKQVYFPSVYISLIREMELSSGNLSFGVYYMYMCL